MCLVFLRILIGYLLLVLQVLVEVLKILPHKLRSVLMPVNRMYRLKEMMLAVRGYYKKKNRQVMFEYVMISGVNDSLGCAQELVDLLKDTPWVVNLIAYNSTKVYKPSGVYVIRKFRDYLVRSGVKTTIRKSYGGDIRAACGQLANAILD